MKYHAFVMTGPVIGHPGHIAYVDYQTEIEAFRHIQWWEEDGCEWAAILDDDGNEYFMSEGAHEHINEMMRRIECY